ncbi:MAG TPA: DUF4198 domain-containing protein [Pyrinomonadaceae bacterium]|jgi:uncharacterized GH25 family protein
MKHFFALALCLLALYASAAAHDYWLQADSFFLAPRSSTLLHLHVGSTFKSELERPLQKQRTVRFQMLSNGGTQDLMAKSDDGRMPVAEVTPRASGNYLLVMERTPQLIALEASKFNEYLAEEGLEPVIKMRAARGQANLEGRERYTRYIKALLQVGDRRDDTYKRIANQRLEIVPQNNPYNLKPGGTLRLRVFFEGQPLKDTRIFAYNRLATDEQARVLSAGLSADGTAAFTLDRAGVWLVRLVYMRPCAGCNDADWESFWAAYTFELR